MTVIKEVLLLFEKIGLLDVVLPFVLVFAVLQGVLNKTKVLGEYAENYNNIVAFLISFTIIASLQMVNIIQKVVQYSALAIIFVIFAVILTKMLGKLPDPTKEDYPKYVALIVIGLVAFYALGFKGWFPLAWIEGTLLPIAVSLGLIVAIVWFVMRPDKTAPSKTQKKEPAPKKKEPVPKTQPKPAPAEKQAPGEPGPVDFELPESQEPADVGSRERKKKKARLKKILEKKDLGKRA